MSYLFLFLSLALLTVTFIQSTLRHHLDELLASCRPRTRTAEELLCRWCTCPACGDYANTPLVHCPAHTLLVPYLPLTTSLVDRVEWFIFASYEVRARYATEEERDILGAYFLWLEAATGLNWMHGKAVLMAHDAGLCDESINDFLNFVGDYMYAVDEDLSDMDAGQTYGLLHLYFCAAPSTESNYPVSHLTEDENATNS